MPAWIQRTRRHLVLTCLATCLALAAVATWPVLSRDAAQARGPEAARAVPAPAVLAASVLAASLRYGPDPAGVHPVYRQTVWYGPAGNQNYDVYWPVGGPRRAGAVFLLHSGMWFGGSKADVSDYALRLARHGWVAAAVGYAGFPYPRPWPAAVNDVFTALDSFRSRSAVYGFDRSRVVAVGFSSGGHLAQLLATVGRGRDRLAAVATFSGISDPADLFRHWESGGCPAYPACAPAGLARVFSDVAGGATPLNSPGLYAEAAPLAHVSAGDASMLLIASTAEVIPISKLTRLAAADRAAGVPVVTVQVPGSRHAEELMPVAQLALLRWLTEYAD